MRQGPAVGGQIIAEGTPEDVARVKESYTGQYLRDLLGRRGRPAEGGQEKNSRAKRQAAE